MPKVIEKGQKRHHMGLEGLAVAILCRTLLAMIKNLGYIKGAKGFTQKQ